MFLEQSHTDRKLRCRRDQYHTLPLRGERRPGGLWRSKSGKMRGMRTVNITEDRMIARIDRKRDLEARKRDLGADRPRSRAIRAWRNF